MSLYNCKQSGDSYRISKFTNDLDVEASYLTNGNECDCPAGHRPVCRHRIMLPRFIAKNATSGQWFHNYEHQQWIRATMDDSEAEIVAAAIANADEQHEAMTQGEDEFLASAASQVEDTADIEREQATEVFHGLQPKPINLLELAKPPQLGGFPDWCLVQDCTTPNDCILYGCVKGHGSPPRINKDHSNSIGHSPAHDALPLKPLRRL